MENKTTKTKTLPIYDASSIGRRMMEVRRYRDLKQSSIGAKMAISQQAYSVLENQRGSIGISTLQRFCEATNVSMHLMLCDNVPINEENVNLFNEMDLNQIIEEYRKYKQNLKFYESMFAVKMAS